MIKNLNKINLHKREQVTKILDVLQHDVSVRRVIIFGSSIRNDCRETSDLDIAVEWSEDCYDEDGIMKDFTLPTCRTISSVTKGNNDLVNIGYEGDLLKSSIEKGVVVYERNNA
jgi:predicted nucleotidyltransferase